MTTREYNEDYLYDLLPLYYRRLFPQDLMYKWLIYGAPHNLEMREISFTLIGDVYVRYQSFANLDELMQTLCKKYPIKIDIGAIYKQNPAKRVPGGILTPLEKELVFDIDLTDYDEVRTCCSGADVCPKCWRLMVIACRVVDAAMRDDFGYTNILWVFSGRRGIHCWVADEGARQLDDVSRAAIADYSQLIMGGLKVKKVRLYGEHIHPSLVRALGIIDKYFLDIVREQDILGNEERLKVLLGFVDDESRPVFREAMKKVETSVERWQAFEVTFESLQQKNKMPRISRHLKEELKLYYAYPRLDISVTKSLNHLLKAPFCVHPKTGKICVPFNPKLVDKFDIGGVPTISQLIDEINSYDAKTLELEKSLIDDEQPVDDDELVVSSVKIKDYKKTSLLKSVNVFNEFLRGLEKSALETKNDDIMEF